MDKSESSTAISIDVQIKRRNYNPPPKKEVAQDGHAMKDF